MATDIMGVSGRAMIEALIGGERDPRVLAELARGRLRVKHTALIEALTGRFDEHHAELARMLLDAYDTADAQIIRLGERIDHLIASIPAARWRRRRRCQRPRRRYRPGRGGPARSGPPG